MTRHKNCRKREELSRVLRTVQTLVRSDGRDLPGLRDQVARIAELDAAFLQFIARWNRGASEGHVRIPYKDLLVLARKTGN